MAHLNRFLVLIVPPKQGYQSSSTLVSLPTTSCRATLPEAMHAHQDSSFGIAVPIVGQSGNGFRDCFTLM